MFKFTANRRVRNVSISLCLGIVFALANCSPALAIDGLMNGKFLTGETDDFVLWLQSYNQNALDNNYYNDLLFLNKTGNLGLGTTAPTAKLQLNPANGVEGLRIITSDYSPFVIRNAANTADIFRIDQNGNITGGIGNSSAWTRNNATSQLYVSNINDKVGVGTTNPTYKLDVAGNTYLNGTANITGGLVVDSPADYDATDVTGLTSAPIQVPQVNIGTTPSFLPFLNQNALYSSGYVTHMSLGLYKGTNAWGTGDNGFYVALGGNDSYPTAHYKMTYGGNITYSGAIGLVAGGLNQNVVLSPSGTGHTLLNGNVGIGTTAPTQKLHVAGDASFLVGTSSPSQVHDVAAPTQGTDVANRNYVDTLISDSVSATDFWKLNGSNLYSSSTAWNVGIGTTAPNQQLEITKNFRLPATSGTTPYGIIYKGGNRFIHDFNYGLNGNGITTDGANTFVGLNAGNFTMGSTATSAGQASYNTGIGAYSLLSNTTGSYNTANGMQSLYSNTTGNANTANGVSSLYFNTTGNDNTANGFYSLFSNTTGANNTANGSQSLRYNTTGSQNTALGLNSGRYLANGTTGRSTGNNGLYLGYNSKASADGTNNEIVIGYNAIGKGSNTATYGNTSMAKHIFEAGNVGIGTTTPQVTLDVNGLIKMRSSQITTTSDVINKGYLDSALEAYGSSNNFWKLNGSNLYSSSTSWNVGIGTTDPTSKLDVNGDIYIESGGALYGNKLGSLKGELIGFNNTLQATRVNYGFYGTNAYNNLHNYGYQHIWYGTGDVERMRISNTGNVGIGTTTPSAKLTVAGGNIFITDAAITSSTPHAAITKTYLDSALETLSSDLSASTTASNYWLANGANIYNKNTGNVGIGVTNPGYKLQVDGVLGVKETSGTNSTRAVIFADDNGAYFTMDGSSAKPIIFKTWTNGSETIRINTNGNVGIGTSNPGTKLSIYDNSAANVNGQEILTLSSIYAQASPGSGGKIAFRLASGQEAANIRGYTFPNGNTGLAFGTGINSGSVKMVINDSGNVGIATATPGYKLDVLGDANFNGSQIHGVAIPTQGTDAVSKNYLTDTLATYPYYYLASRDTRAVADLPSDFNAVNGIKFDFKSNGVNGLNDGGSYNGVMTWRKYGASVSDFSGGPSLQLAYTDNGNLWTRLSTSASAWGTWKQMLNSDTGVVLQPNTPGAQQTGNINISGTIIAGTISATGLTGTVNASNVTPGAFNSTLGTGGNYSFPASVGIGVANPVSRLHVSTLGAGDDALGQRWSYNGGDSSYYLDLKQTVTSGVVRWNFSQLNNGTAYNDVLVFDRGNVGIGTTDPGAFKLKVAGNVAITGTLQTMTGSDFAEEFTVSSPLEAGTVVVMGDLGYKSVKACGEKFDSTVVGVVSDNPSIIAGRVDSKHKVVVAMAGVVKVKVSDVNGKIKKGTMLTTSNISGYAMKADNNHPGTIIGKALEDLSGKQGEIKVLINLQ